MTDDSVAAFEACAEIARLAASNDTDGLVDALRTAGRRGIDLAASLDRLQLGPLVRGALASARAGGVDTSDVQAVIDHMHRATRATPAQLLEAFVLVRDALEAVGIPVLLLKGAVLAQQLYGDLARRPQYDIDLLVVRRDSKRARRVLASLGYRRRGRDDHSVTVARGPIHVDLHYALRTSPAYAIDEAGLWRRARPQTIAGTRLHTLADEDTLTLLTTSVVEDAAFGMAKLKNLCDIWLLIGQLDAAADWEGWFDARRSEHLEAVAANGCALALDVMSASGDVPRMASALDRRHNLVHVAGREHALALMTSTKGSVANMAWLGRFYPGSLLRFRLRPLVFGLPGSLRDVRSSPLRFHARVVRARHVAPAGRSSA